MSEFNPLDHVELLADVDEKRWERLQLRHPNQKKEQAFVVPIDKLLNAMVPRVKKALEEKEKVPLELIDSKLNNVAEDPTIAARRYYREAKKLPTTAYDDALMPKGDVPVERLKSRATAIEICRKWFQRAVAVKTGPGNFFALTKAATEGIGLL